MSGDNSFQYLTTPEQVQAWLQAAQAAGVPRFVHTSSPSAVWSGGDEEGLSESDCPYPEQYLAFYANDLFPYGGGTPQTIGDGEVWFDNIAFAIVPFADETGSPADAVRPAIPDGLLEGVWPQVGVAEAAP